MASLVVSAPLKIDLSNDTLFLNRSSRAKLVVLLLGRSELGWDAVPDALLLLPASLKKRGLRLSFWCGPMKVFCIFGIPLYAVFEYKSASTILFHLTLCWENAIARRDVFVK